VGSLPKQKVGVQRKEGDGFERRNELVMHPLGGNLGGGQRADDVSVRDTWSRGRGIPCRGTLPQGHA